MIARWIDDKLRRMFYHVGRAVAFLPAPFILLPLIASGLLGYFGISKLAISDDLEYLFTPENNQARLDRDAMEAVDFFPTDNVAWGSTARVIIQAADGKDVLFRDDVFAEVLRFHNVLRTTNTTSGVSFDDLCIRVTDGSCVVSNALQLMIDTGSGTNLTDINLTFPYYNPNGLNYTLGLYLGNELGGVEFGPDRRTVLSSTALQFVYIISGQWSTWTDTFLQVCSEFDSDKITVNYNTYRSLNDELLALPTRVIPYLVAAVGLLVLFSVASCMMLDWVLTKPWLAFMGVLSALLAIVSSFGLVLLTGEQFSTLVAVVPFLLIGVGVDDMFVMIAAWRKCDVRLPVQERMGRAMSDAAASITITSITDCVAFAVGVISVFPSVRIFCTYAAIGVAFDYLYQITFFAAIMSLAGRRERANRHCFTCCPVLPKSQARNKNAAYRLCCAGGVSREDNPSNNQVVNKDPFLTTILYKYLAPTIVKTPSKVILFILYAGYLGVAIWGCFQVNVGLRFQSLAADDSYVVAFHNPEEAYFKDYGPKIDIVITEPVEYWTTDVQQAVLDKLKAFDESQYFYDTSETAEVWLRDYLRFLNQTGNSHAATNKTAFMQILVNQFLPQFGRQHQVTSLKFADFYENITASRFFVIPNNVKTKEREKDMMIEARSIARKGPVKMVAFATEFIFAEQVVSILPSTLQTVGIAAAAMFVVSFLFIPHCVATVFVTFALVSIDVGLVGYMALWGVQLDIVSMTSIIICIGFSVDFSAHITYAYVSSQATTPTEKLSDAFRAVGMPILQASLSTILGMVVLAFFPAYLFKAFFKTIFLVMAFGAAHGLVILPTLLTILPDCGSKPSETKVADEKNMTNIFSNGHLSSNLSTHSLSPSKMQNKPQPVNGAKRSSSLPTDLNRKLGTDNPYFTPEMRTWLKSLKEKKTGIDNPAMDGPSIEVTEL
ncbi:patched domain-containing protein 3-like [Branchiostoma floridae]|uniref:Patched domain-containing protein 3 n=2 Tax=Branchiostoma floridae TaxID=7739 RepID=A0A9J7NDE3_BRAFL|nr:patched domain-containing protein 3-like [Branchiostoma floridae]